jgi:hypothetical protein
MLRPFGSTAVAGRLWRGIVVSMRQVCDAKRSDRVAHLLLHLHIRAHSLDAIAALDDIGLERNGSRATVQLEEQTAGVAKNGTHLVATP